MAEKKFWLRVDDLAKTKGTNPEALAIACQVPLSTLKEWMENNKYPPVIEGYKIARELGVTVEFLVTGQEHLQEKDLGTVSSLLCKAEEILKKKQG